MGLNSRFRGAWRLSLSIDCYPAMTFLSFGVVRSAADIGSREITVQVKRLVVAWQLVDVDSQNESSARKGNGDRNRKACFYYACP